jgi:hypothetical protein
MVEAKRLAAIPFTAYAVTVRKASNVNRSQLAETDRTDNELREVPAADAI